MNYTYVNVISGISFPAFAPPDCLVLEKQIKFSFPYILVLHLHLFVSNPPEMKMKESIILSFSFFLGQPLVHSRKGNIYWGEI